MPTYKYVAKDKTGETISGTLEADNVSGLIGSLRSKGLIIISVTEERKKKPALRLARGGRIKLDDLVIFLRQLATMVDAGIPLTQGLDILSEQAESKRLREIISKVHDDVEGGSSLSEALGKYEKAFSTIFISMVRAGESSGTLDVILDRLATYLEKVSTLIKKVRSALIYPTVVTVIAILITLILLLKVIPVFKEIFAGFGAKLPTPTLVLINFSDFLRHNFFYGVLILIVLVFGFNRYTKTERGKLRFDRSKLRLPIFGILFRKVAISKFSRTLSTLVKSGVPILSSLEIVAKTSGNRVVELAVDEVRNSIREGESIAEPLSKCGVFPPMVVRMISVGEKTGELEKMLSKIADFYDEQVDIAVSGLTSMIEPLIIAFLGIVIGTIVICMFMPIFKISQIVQF